MTKALLIDANCFAAKHLPELIHEAIKEEGLQVISSQGTKLETELKNADKQFFSTLKSAARILEICSFSVQKKTSEIEELERMRYIQSNDTAVLAGAIVSRANTLVTKDADLKKDFKKCASIDQKTGCKHRIDLPANSCRKVITPTHAAGPKWPEKGTPARKVRKLLAEACCSPVSCNCVNGGPTC
ncbi:MAG: type II toxin-antitoxin system VapC family toxin [Candidatus Puniceispirillaceae bacterium]